MSKKVMFSQNKVSIWRFFGDYPLTQERRRSFFSAWHSLCLAELVDFLSFTVLAFKIVSWLRNVILHWFSHLAFFWDQFQRSLGTDLILMTENELQKWCWHVLGSFFVVAFFKHDSVFGTSILVAKITSSHFYQVFIADKQNEQMHFFPSSLLPYHCKLYTRTKPKTKFCSEDDCFFSLN